MYVGMRLYVCARVCACVCQNEQRVKAETKYTIRCYPLSMQHLLHTDIRTADVWQRWDAPLAQLRSIDSDCGTTVSPLKCMYSKQTADRIAIFARSY